MEINCQGIFSLDHNIKLDSFEYPCEYINTTHFIFDTEHVRIKLYQIYCTVKKLNSASQILQRLFC